MALPRFRTTHVRKAVLPTSADTLRGGVPSKYGSGKSGVDDRSKYRFPFWPPLRFLLLLPLTSPTSRPILPLSRPPSSSKPEEGSLAPNVLVASEIERERTEGRMREARNKTRKFVRLPSSPSLSDAEFYGEHMPRPFGRIRSRSNFCKLRFRDKGKVCDATRVRTLTRTVIQLSRKLGTGMLHTRHSRSLRVERTIARTTTSQDRNLLSCI